MKDIYDFRNYPNIEDEELMNKQLVVDFIFGIPSKLRYFKELDESEIEEEIGLFKDECCMIGLKRFEILCNSFLHYKDEDLREEILEIFDECLEDIKEDDILKGLI